MAFKDIINKGTASISKGIDAIKGSVNKKKETMEEFEKLKASSEPFILSNQYVVNNPDPQKGKEEFIMSACLTLNRDKAALVNKIIPAYETIVSIVTGKEANTNVEFIFALTNMRLWVFNHIAYIIYPMDNLPSMHIVNKSVMSQGVEFDNRAFLMDGNEKTVDAFIQILIDNTTRANAINEKTSYLCGIMPHIQLLNAKLKGITIDTNKNIVLHNHPNNILISPNDINTVEILVNDSVAYIKGRTQSQSLISSPMEARTMSVKVITNTSYHLIEVLPASTMGTSYKKEDSTYIENYEFSKKIVDTIYELIKEY